MRRLNHSDRDDQGVATILLICVMAALFTAAGLGVDVSHHYFEARSAQNSADATVMAVATDCAITGSPILDYTPYYKSTNGQTINTPACGSGTTTITVTKDVNGGLLLQRDRHTVTRSATARWGTIGTATTLPITISSCEFTAELLAGTTDITLFLDDPKPQSGCSSLPGGFSSLESAEDCSVTVSAGGTVEGQPGGGELHKVIPCVTPLPQQVLIPMYDSVACQADLSACKGGNGAYPIIGFAMFTITGYSFNGNVYSGSLGKDCPFISKKGDRGMYCIRGDFIEFVTSQGSPGPSTDFGTYNVYLYS
jgi:Flp pilus assembly protein TadG